MNRWEFKLLFDDFGFAGWVYFVVEVADFGRSFCLERWRRLVAVELTTQDAVRDGRLQLLLQANFHDDVHEVLKGFVLRHFFFIVTKNSKQVVRLEDLLLEVLAAPQVRYVVAPEQVLNVGRVHVRPHVTVTGV